MPCQRERSGSLQPPARGLCAARPACRAQPLPGRNPLAHCWRPPPPQVLRNANVTPKEAKCAFILLPVEVGGTHTTALKVQGFRVWGV